MKIQQRSIPKFLRAPTAPAILVHGDDAGHACEIAEILADRASGREVVKLDAEDVVADPRSASDAGRSPGLFDTGTTPASVRIRGTANGLDKAMSRVLDDMNTNARVIVEADGYLRASSGLRKLFEKDSRAASIDCPSPSTTHLRSVVDAEAAAHGVALSEDAAAHLLERIPPDTGAARAEAHKIVLLCPGGTATVEDVDAVTGDGSEASVDEACNAAASGQPGAADAAARRVLDGDIKPIGLLRMTRNHFLRLARARADADSGAGPAKAAGRAKPPVYGARKNALIEQLRIWPAHDAERALEKIDDAEAAAKLAAGAAPHALARHTLWELAWRARSLAVQTNRRHAREGSA